jgi:hypothetical protein
MENLPVSTIAYICFFRTTARRSIVIKSSGDEARSAVNNLAIPPVQLLGVDINPNQIASQAQADVAPAVTPQPRYVRFPKISGTHEQLVRCGQTEPS